MHDRGQRFNELVQARVTYQILRRLERVAEKRCQTLSALVRAFIVRGLEREEKLAKKPEPVRLIADGRLLKRLGIDKDPLEEIAKPKRRVRKVRKGKKK